MLQRQVPVENARLFAAAFELLEDRFALPGRERAVRTIELHRPGRAHSHVWNKSRQRAARGKDGK